MAKILIIDDDGIVRDALTVFFTRAGHQVFSAADGGNGVLLFKNVGPDLVVLDRDMPVKTGSVVFKEIREISKGTPVIILTGYDAPEDAEAYLRDGAASFLSKGDGLSVVLDAVDKLLGRQRPRQETAASARQPVKPAQAGSRGLLLAADDDPAILNILKRFLTSLGFEVITAEDGTRTVALARERRPDIILLDILMPGKDGIEVLKDLRPEMPGTGFIMITGNEDEDVAKACLNLGAFDYIEKPVNLDLLGNILKARMLIQRSQG
ncbi:MAG: response regulator [Elusimicrobiales bacterium]|nr:response regulator [Elusimicrobiales bacterium]